MEMSDLLICGLSPHFTLNSLAIWGKLVTDGVLLLHKQQLTSLVHLLIHPPSDWLTQKAYNDSIVRCKHKTYFKEMHENLSFNFSPI